ncbi:MAG: hypothetical protein LBW77_03165 [Verrucomicrobiota bacterium]|jgi:hypothetical protein|nr:hypothetical protein [Verrucomicrobiota bacterium]
MKAVTSRVLVWGLLVFSCSLGASAATRLCSVYVESLAALQKQIYLGAEAFQAPALGALPMLIAGGLPGAAQLDNNKPLAAHVFDTGDGETGIVVEAVPAAAPEAYLQALAGGAALPEAKDGIYTLGGQAAKVAAGRVFFVPEKKHVSLLADGVEKLSDMPAIPGVLRLTIYPAALAPKVKVFATNIPVTGTANAEEGRRVVEGITGFYAGLLEQLDAWHLGINVQTEGLFLRARLAPKAGSDLAALVASGKPVAPRQLAFIEKDAIFSYASGPSKLPAGLERQLTDLYGTMLASTLPKEEGVANEMAAIIKQSLNLLGAPVAFSVGQPAAAGQSFRIGGFWELADPAGYLKLQVEQSKNPAIKKVTEQSGMVYAEPTVRESQGLQILTFKLAFDDKLAEKNIREKMPAGLPPEVVDGAVKTNLETLRKIMPFINGYEYAATAKELLFGMGAGQIETVAERLKAPPAASAEAARIEKLLAPSGDPTGIGRFSLNQILLIALADNPQLTGALKALPAGDGIVFAGWSVGGEALSATLIPASDIKAAVALGMAAQAAQGGGGRRNAPPARPPIPENF